MFHNILQCIYDAEVRLACPSQLASMSTGPIFPQFFRLFEFCCQFSVFFGSNLVSAIIGVPSLLLSKFHVVLSVTCFESCIVVLTILWLTTQLEN